MPLRLLASLFLALLAAAAVRAGDYPVKEPFSRTAPFNATGALIVDNVNGSVTVRTWDKNEIRIEGVKSAKSAEELRLIELTMDVTASRAQLRVKLPKRAGGWLGRGSIRAAVRFEITVPATARLESIETVNSSIQIEGVRGDVHAETVNGGIHATNLGGDARLETVNGGIEADFATLGSSQRLACETVNGRITLRLPENPGFELRSSVVNGHIDCEFPIQLSGSSRRTLNGRVGDGRAEVEAETVNGSITIARR